MLVKQKRKSPPIKFPYKEGDKVRDFTFIAFDKFNNYGNKFSFWKCLCGNIKSIRDAEIRRGRTKNCGCKINSKLKQHNDAGQSLDGGRHYLYKTWDGIKQRCYNPNSTRYSFYGGLGVVLCEEWKTDYPTFKQWVLDNLGERPSKHSLDRIDNNGNYEPGNLKWSTYSEQNFNRGH